MYKLSEISQNVIDGNAKAFLYTSSYKNENAVSYLFGIPYKIISINFSDDLNKKFIELDEVINQNKILLCKLNYEAGYLFEERLQKYLVNQNILMNFFCFDENEIKVIPSKEIELNPFEQNFGIKNYSLNETKNEYVKKIGKIKNFIREGDTYQVNYTLKAKFNFSGEINDLFQNLIFNQSTQYSALINDDENFIISISPELFFSTNANNIESKPMKGTIKRGINLKEDFSKKEILLNSKKDRAENIMIVDLLRNDIGKISLTDSIEVKSIFDIEKYETIYQLTSKIEGKLKTNKYSEIIKNLFPCGSITGAPKIRTMRIIKELEKEERGIYTGAIGFVNNNKSVFNVAIRTIVLEKKSLCGELGLGSGIVWDSIGEEEYEEVKLKGNFLLKPDNYFEIFETMLFENNEVFLLEEHLERLKNSADFLMFKFNRKKILSELVKEIENHKHDKKFKIRLSLRKDGKIKIDVFEESIVKSKRILISENKINSKNKFQYFKTTNRELYNTEFAFTKENNFVDVIYFNEKDELAEGAISNIMILLDSKWQTPLIESGILAGTYRAKFIEENSVIENKLFLKDLLNAEKIILTNSVKKEIEIFEIYKGSKQVWSKK